MCHPILSNQSAGQLPPRNLGWQLAKAQVVAWPTATTRVSTGRPTVYCGQGQSAECLSRCPGLPRQRETGCRKLATAGCDRLSQARGRWLRQAVASSRPLVATGSRNLEAAGCDRQSQARGRWLRQAVVASSRPLAATGCRDLEAACCDSLSQPRGRWLRQAVASSQPVVATGCRKLAMAEIKILGILISATRQRVCRGSAEGLASDRPVSRC